jgi:HPt (histidine-containing phosphotransfer) domain-containing protein
MTPGAGDRYGGKITVFVEEDLQELIPGYLENRVKDIAAIREALARKDYEAIRTLGHKMKGSGGGYGFDAITDIGHGIEEAAKREHGDEIVRLAEELKSYLERVDVIYQG